MTGRGGSRYRAHAGIRLEPQHAPDSLHHPDWPSVLPDPTEPYHHRIHWSFARR